MNSKENHEKRDFIKCLVIKSFERVGRLKSEISGQMSTLIDDLLGENIDLETLKNAFNYHAKNSRFAPTLCDIIEYVEKPNTQDEADFMERFRRKGLSPYAWDGLDADIYTVRKAVGAERLIGCTKQEYTWLEKEVRAAYRQLKKGEIKLIENPIKNNIKELPCGGNILGKPDSIKDSTPAFKALNLRSGGGNVFS